MAHVLLIVHIVGFSLMIGWGAGVLMLPIVAANTEDPRGVEFMWRMILKEDYIFMPAAVLIILSGIGQIIVSRHLTQNRVGPVRSAGVEKPDLGHYK